MSTVIGSVPTGPVAQHYETVFTALSSLENDLNEHRKALSAGSWRPSAGEVEEALHRLAEQVLSTRNAVDALREAQRVERRRLGHDMRVALGAIAGWTHILRLEKSASETVTRAADVLDRNVRALARVIDSVPS